jgi:hypothetical protein
MGTVKNVEVRNLIFQTFPVSRVLCIGQIAKIRKHIFRAVHNSNVFGF